MIIKDVRTTLLTGPCTNDPFLSEARKRDAKLLEIGGGTLEAHQKNITRDLEKNPGTLV